MGVLSAIPGIVAADVGEALATAREHAEDPVGDDTDVIDDDLYMRARDALTIAGKARLGRRAPRLDPDDPPEPESPAPPIDGQGTL